MIKTHIYDGAALIKSLIETLIDFEIVRTDNYNITEKR